MKKILLTLTILIIAAAGIVWAATGDESAALRSSFDLRTNIRPVWDANVIATWDDDDTGNVTQAININGIIQKVVFVTPDATNSVTYQVEILDNEDNVIFDSGEQAENATYTFSLHEPVTGTIDVRIGPSGALGATNPDAIVVLRGI